MKNLYNFKTFLLLAVFSLFAGTAMAADEEITFSGDNATAVEKVDGKDVTITFDKGTNNSNAPKWYNSGNAIRCYGGNTVTFAATKDIAEITFTFGSGDGSNAITASTGTFSSPTWTGEASEVTFTIGGTKGNRRLAAVAITYADQGTVQKTATTVSFLEASYSFEMGSSEAIGFAGQTAELTDDSGLPLYENLVYSYAPEGSELVSSFDSETGSIMLADNVSGTVTVSAKYEGNDTYKASNTASYTVTVYKNVDIADFKALADNTTETIVLKDAQVLYVNGTNDLYIRDSSAAIDLYRSGLSYTAGQILNGTITATKTTYNNLVETTGTITANVTVADGSDPEPVDATVATAGNYDSNLVKLSNVTVSDGTITEGSASVTVYDKFKTNLTFDATKQYNIVGIIVPYNDAIQLCPLSAEEVVVAGYVAAPTFSVEAGEVEAGTQVTIASEEGTSIFYQLNGGEAQEVQDNEVVLTINTDTTIAAWAEDGDGNTSETVTAAYTIKVVVAQPIIENASRTVEAGTVINVQISVDDFSAPYIYYTTDGSDPTTSDTRVGPSRFAASFDLTVEETTTVIAVAATAAGKYSDPVSVTFTVLKPEVTFDFENNNYGFEVFTTGSSYETNNYTATVDPITLAFSEDDGKNFRIWSNSSGQTMRIYSGKEFTISAESGYVITGITFTGGQQFSSADNLYDSSNGTWTGEAQSVTFTKINSSSANVKTITVAYKTGSASSAETITVSISDAGYATLFYSDKNLVVPAGVSAYTVRVENGELLQENIAEGEAIPYGTGVVLEGAAGDYDFTAYEMGDDTNNAFLFETNMLYGSDVDGQTVAPESGDFKFYKLAIDDDDETHVGFFFGAEDGAAFATSAHKAYLAVPAAQAAGIRGFLLGGAQTAIQAIAAQKADGKVYDLQGRRVNNAEKGVFIINGKKVIK